MDSCSKLVAKVFIIKCRCIFITRFLKPAQYKGKYFISSIQFWGISRHFKPNKLWKKNWQNWQRSLNYIKPFMYSFKIFPNYILLPRIIKKFWDQKLGPKPCLFMSQNVMISANSILPTRQKAFFYLPIFYDWNVVFIPFFSFYGKH